MFSGTPMPALYSVPEPQPSAICIVRPKTKAPTSRLTLGGPSAACSSGNCPSSGMLKRGGQGQQQQLADHALAGRALR
jgi:hypothetical protein